MPALNHLNLFCYVGLPVFSESCCRNPGNQIKQSRNRTVTGDYLKIYILKSNKFLATLIFMHQFFPIYFMYKSLKPWKQIICIMTVYCKT